MSSSSDSLPRLASISRVAPTTVRNTPVSNNMALANSKSPTRGQCTWVKVLVRNGETVVLGGILTTEQLKNLFKTPFLGDIPVLGHLFRYTEQSNQKVELLVFITPKIIEDRLAIR